jgi:hypothetical protein
MADSACSNVITFASNFGMIPDMTTRVDPLRAQDLFKRIARAGVIARLLQDCCAGGVEGEDIFV